MLGLDVEHPRQAVDETAGMVVGMSVVLLVLCEKFVIVPDRLTVFAPITSQRPAWQRLAGIPFALAEMEQAVRGEFLL